MSTVRIVSADEVRTWARKRGIAVSDRGRLSPSVVSAYNRAHKASQYVVQPRPAVTVVKMVGQRADKRGRNRKVTVEATVPAIRTWAQSAGFTVGQRGRIPATVKHAYSIREANFA